MEAARVKAARRAALTKLAPRGSAARIAAQNAAKRDAARRKEAEKRAAADKAAAAKASAERAAAEKAAAERAAAEKAAAERAAAEKAAAEKAAAEKAAAEKAAAEKAAAEKAAAEKAAAEKAAAEKAAAEKAAAFDKLLRATATPTLTQEQILQIAALARPEPEPEAITLAPEEPATVTEWQELFYSLPTTQWGGGDVSVSARLESGRRLWMYGDTLSSNNIFVHSSAIVTHGRTARVANRGGHVLPTEPVEDGRKTVYWTETLVPVRGEYALVTTTPVSLNLQTSDTFDFYRTQEESRQGLVHVNADGDVRFLGWVGWVPRPDIGMDGEDFRSPQPGHYTYGAYVHAIRLENGSFLRTRNRNYDSLDRARNPDGTLRYEMWRPLFEESTTRGDPYWGW